MDIGNTHFFCQSLFTISVLIHGTSMILERILPAAYNRQDTLQNSLFRVQKTWVTGTAFLFLLVTIFAKPLLTLVRIDLMLLALLSAGHSTS